MHQIYKAVFTLILFYSYTALHITMGLQIHVFFVLFIFQFSSYGVDGRMGKEGMSSLDIYALLSLSKQNKKKK